MPKSQRNFLEVLDDDNSKNNSVGNEIHIVGDFNISLLLNGFDTVGKKKRISGTVSQFQVVLKADLNFAHFLDQNNKSPNNGDK